MKITLGEIDAFEKSLSDEWYFEDDELPDEFWEGNFDPSETVEIKKGDVTICYQGNNDIEESKRCKDFISEFIKWKFIKWKTRIDYEIVSVKIPKGKKEDLLALIKERYGETT